MTARTISIVIPAYNAACYLPEAFASLFAQTWPAAEILVVDDGSTDETAKVCEAYKDRVRLFRQPNRGQAAARNLALQQARGEFIALQDADDLCAPDRLERQVQALLARPEAVACFSGHWVFNASGITGRYPGKPEHAERSAIAFATRLLVHPITMMYRRSRAGDLRFPEEANPAEDMLFCGLLRRRGPVIILPDVLYGYRRHAHQATARASDLDSLHKRIAWVRCEGPIHWPELAPEEYEAEAWNAMAEQLRDHYWMRRRREFFQLRQRLNEHWPDGLPPPPELHLRWYPDILWSLKAAYDSWVVRRRRRRVS